MTVDLTRELDRVKAKAFVDSNSAFLGPIMCSLRWIWCEKTPTASVDGIAIRFNPKRFMSVSLQSRVLVLMHELWHVARMHQARRNGRDPKWWNIACDIWINNMLETSGFNFSEFPSCYKDQCFKGKTEEEIYQAIYDPKSTQPPPSGGAFGDGFHDLVDTPQENTDVQHEEVVTVVLQAMLQAKMTNPGSVPGDTETLINQFLAPVVPWERAFHGLMTDLADEDYTWARPSRRHQDMYLPSRFLDEGKLAKLNYYLDVSGSIGARDTLRFNSEVKHVWEYYQPRQMNLIQFDTRISKSIEIVEGDELNEITVVGGGGTCLVPVREHIIKHKPTAAIIFSDMMVKPMEPLPFDIPVIWVVLGGYSYPKPSFGRVIEIPPEKI